jgi:ribosomal protein S18 acetylase RimI-like enzyme
MSQIGFRRYRPEDCTAVWSVFTACTNQLGFHIGPWDDDMQDIAGCYLQSGEFIVGEFEGRIIAFAGLQRDSGHRAAVRRVGVHPSVQSRGFGKALLAELERTARKMGITTLHLDTSISQIAAQKLYSSCGYEEKGHVVLGGIECILFEKTLDHSDRSMDE